MRNAEDYIRDEPDGSRTVTSTAYWLTSEGINAFHAAVIRDFIATLSDEDFAEIFDGASKDEAREFLEKWEFCHMPHWGPEEVAHAIAMSESGRNQSFVLRAVFLAQKVGDLPEFFTPSDGIKWALQNGYLITRELRDLTSVTAWVLASPPVRDALIEKPPLEPAPPAILAPQKEPVSAPRKAAILSWLRANGYDPQNFPKFSCRAPGGKAAVKEAMLALQGLGFTDSTFEGAWEELRKTKEIRDKKE
jgi:hypothetical protein